MKYYLLSTLLLPILIFGQTISPPAISHESGFYTEEFYLTITHPDPTVTILYTLDGSEPKIENLTGKVWNYKKQYPTNPNDPSGPLIQDTVWTYEYTSSIPVTNRTNDSDKYADISASYYTNYWYNNIAKQDSINVFKGVVLNAIAYKNGIYSKVITRNYFVSPEGSNRYSLPVTCLNIDPEKFFSYESGLNVPGLLFDEWRGQNPLAPIDRMWAPANFRASGSGSEIELNFTYLVDGQQILNHGAGLRLHGNGSRYFPNRSYRLYAKSGYGASSFNYSFFPHYSESSFKRIILRNSGNDCVKTMFRDAFIQQASKNLNFEIQEYQPSILFINGEYFGLYNIRERFDDKYFEQMYNIDVNELDFLENLGEVQEGDNSSYNSLIDFLENNSLIDENNYNHVAELIDIINFTDYYITEIFISNIDWPTNNIEYWRKRVPYNPNAPYGHDGRWRWILKDLDYSFGYRWDNKTYDYDDLSVLSTPSDSDSIFNKATLIFRSLLENESYKVYFINRFSDILNTTYKSNLLISKINEMKDKISPEIQEFIDRWNPTNEHLLSYHPVHSYPIWSENIDIMKTFAQHRPYWTRSHIQNRFEAGNQMNLILGISDRTEGYIELNSIKIKEGTDGIDSLSPYPWSGVYFKAIPVTLKAIPEPGYEFSHWSGEIYDTAPEITLNLNRDSYIKANFRVCPSDIVTLNPLPNLCQNHEKHSLTEGIPRGGTYSIEGVNVTKFDPSLGTQTIIYLYEDQNGCIDSDTLTVIVHSVPIVDAGVDQFVCVTEEVTLAGSGDAVSYSWNNGVTDNIPFIPSILTGEYTVTGTGINGCSNTDKVTVTVNPLPNVIITQTGDMLTVSSGSISYQWINCETNTPIAEATNRSFIVPESGNYAVAIGNQFGCNDTSVCLYVDFVGIDQLEVSNDIKVYPNPTSDKLFISFSFPLTEYPTLTIVDLQGKTVHSENLADNIQQYKIEVSHLLSGVYLINIGNKYVRFMKN